MTDGKSEDETPRRRKREREPLEISCKGTKCNKGLHCFLEGPQTNKEYEKIALVAKGMCEAIGVPEYGGTVTISQNSGGQSGQHCCWDCGANLVDWNRVYQLDLSDAEYTLGCLKFELIRHYFWHIEIDQYAVNHAFRKGLRGMRLATEKRIRQYVGSGVLPGEPTFDGRQTPYDRNAICYAQHATATCCRKCMEIWYGIPRSEDLTDSQIQYFTDLIMLFIQDRLPDLGEIGIKVPPIRKENVLVHHSDMSEKESGYAYSA